MRRPIPTVQIDAPEVRVTEWRLPPGSATGHHRHEYDYVVVNADIERAFADVRAILAAERLKRERQPGLSAFVRELQGKL